MRCSSYLAVILITGCLASVGRPVVGEPPRVWPDLVTVGIAVESRIITFDKDPAGFRPANQCRLSVKEGTLLVESLGEDPYLIASLPLPGNAFEVVLRMRTSRNTVGAVYWTCGQSGHWGEDKVRPFPVTGDGQWHEYRVQIETPGGLRELRIDPGTVPGVFEIASIRLTAVQVSTVAIEDVLVAQDHVRVSLRNDGQAAVQVRLPTGPSEIPAGQSRSFEIARKRSGVLEGVMLEVLLPGADRPDRRTLWIYDDGIKAEWTVVPGELGGGLIAELSPRDNVLRVRRGEQTLAAVAPIVGLGDDAPGVISQVPQLTATSDGQTIRLEGSGVSGQIRVQSGEITLRLQATGDYSGEIEGPVVRAFGQLEQGLFAGLEYLGKGEKSSSTLDIETEEHIRFAPDRLKVTMPLMAFVTDRGGVALTWTDMGLQPIYASPNAFDGTGDHRMSLRGREVEAVLKVGDTRLEDQILWAVKRKGLPPLPKPPRTADEQKALCLWALTEGPIRNEKGWGHCVEPNWVRRFHADMVSTIWRLSGKLPEVPELVPGGAHLPDESAWFLTGRAGEWLQMTRSHVEDLIRQQQPDGSFRYSGPYAKGHFEDTASGYCARPAVLLLDAAFFTGDKRALEAGLKTLEYMKRFRTPRGAQTWELSLHTPDILASAHLVHAYVRGYQLTGNAEYLELARRWALTGVPFVYLWGEYPVMTYATIPVYGATNWRAPNWMGLPVQWCGLVYAYSLTMLAPYDKTLNWRQLAEGILVAGEQMQVPREEGDYAGLLPDSFHLRLQRRQGPFINPCALVNLRLALEGKPHRLEVASNEKHRVVSPFPVALEGDRAVIQGLAGTRYQIVIDGERVVDVDSRGTDVIPLP